MPFTVITKVSLPSFEILENALNQAKAGRMHILDKIQETITEPRADLKPHAPRIVVMFIPKDLIGAVIGPGGKIIQNIQAETGAVVSIEEIGEQGRVEIASANKESLDAAVAKIRGIVAIPEVGDTYNAKVKSIMPYGAFVEFMPGKEGLLHISELKWERVETMDQAGLKEGEMIEVKLLDIDEKTGKFKLSHKALLPRPPREERPPREPRS